MGIPEEAVAAFRQAWESTDSMAQLGAPLPVPGTRTRAGLEAALPHLLEAIDNEDAGYEIEPVIQPGARAAVVVAAIKLRLLRELRA